MRPAAEIRSRPPAHRLIAALTAFVVAAACAMAATAHARTRDYGLDERAWNGLSRLLRLAEDNGIQVETPAELRMEELSSGDGLLIVHPTRPLPQRAMSAFMRDGGRVALADDFGQGAALLKAFRIRRTVPKAPPRDRWLRGNRALLIATASGAQGNHPLATGVQALVTNHPATLFHPGLEPVFALNDDDDAIVLSGAVGAGRLVAIGDPSMLINNMLAFDGNQRFARNLLGYLAGGPGGRLVVVSGDTRVIAADGDVSLPPLSALRQGLSRLATLALPRAALQAATWVLTLALLLAAVTALPRPAAAARATAFTREEPTAGFPGQVRFHRQHPEGLFEPLLAFANEFERTLCVRLGLPPAADQRELLAKLKHHLPPDQVSERVAACAQLLGELRNLRAAAGSVAEAPRIGYARFSALVTAGQDILQSIDADHP